MPIDQAALTDGEVRAAPVQMAQVITAQTQAITTQTTIEGASRENTNASTMASRLKDVTRMLTWSS